MRQGSRKGVCTDLPLGLLGVTCGHVRAGADSKGQVVCRVCKTGHAITRVALPFVLKYLVTELAAMNIKCTFTITQ